jgi:hypothetical protein
MSERDHYRWYVSLARLKRRMGISATTDDTMLEEIIDEVSAFIEQATDRIFIPETRTYYFDSPKQSSTRLNLGRDLLSVTTLTDDSGTISSSDYFLYNGYDDLNTPPYTVIDLLRSNEYFQFSDTRQKAITIAGEWGYTNAFEDTGATVLNNPLAADGTSLTALTGLLSVGDSLLIGSEQIFVSAITTGDPNDTITIKRAQGGTTAAEHDSTTAIYRYLPPRPIVSAATKIATAWYNEREQGDNIKREEIGDYMVEYFGEMIPSSVVSVLKRFERIDMI